MSLKMTSELVDLINNNTGEPPPGACPNCTPPQICSLTQGQNPDDPDNWECEFFNDDDTNSGVDPTEGCAGGKSINTALGCIPFEQDAFIPAFLKFIMGIAGIIALVIMIIGSVTVMTGGGNPEQVKKGKELFTGAVIGILFIIFSVVILRIIAGDIIGLPGFTQ